MSQTAESTITISKDARPSGGMLTTAAINRDNAQLFKLIRGTATDVMWRGGAPAGLRPSEGWQNSEIVMFPIVGPAPNKRITVAGKELPMVQHGTARDLPWGITRTTDDSVTMVQTYKGGTEVKSAKGVSVFPCSYELEKVYSIVSDGTLKFSLKVTNISDAPLPYAIGWHPAFVRTDARDRLTISSMTIEPAKRHIALEEVIKAERNVIVFENSRSLVYTTLKFTLRITHDFGDTQVWDKGQGYVAFEPISSPSLVELGTEDIDLLSVPSFRKLIPGESKVYTALVYVSP